MKMRVNNSNNLKVFQEHTEADERRRTFIFDTAQDHGNICFPRLMFISTTSPLVLCMYKFVLNPLNLLLHFFLQAWIAANKAYLRFWLVCTNENDCCTPW